MDKGLQGLSQNILDKIIEVVCAHKKVEKIVIFGSRVNGEYSRVSDIDIAIFGKEWTDSDINIVKNRLDEVIQTPLKFDLVNFYDLRKDKLKENILKEGKVIYESGTG